MIKITSKRITNTGELVEVAAVRSEPNMPSYVSVFARLNGGAWKTISPIMKNDKGIYGSFMNKYAVLRSEYDAAQKEWSNMPKSVEELLEIYKSLRESVAFSGGNLSSAIHAGDCADYAKAAMKDKDESKTALQELEKFMMQNQSIVAEYEKRQKDNAQRFIEAGPETDGEIHLFEVSSRSKSGLPNAYENHFPIGKAELPSSFGKLLGRMTQKEPEGKIIGATQPRGHGEKNVSDPRFGIKPGKGRGITIT